MLRKALFILVLLPGLALANDHLSAISVRLAKTDNLQEWSEFTGVLALGQRMLCKTGKSGLISGKPPLRDCAVGPSTWRSEPMDVYIKLSTPTSVYVRIEEPGKVPLLQSWDVPEKGVTTTLGGWSLQLQREPF
jgi:hypothetical protein